MLKNPLETHPLALARYKSLDIWRGLACVFVVLLHGTLYGPIHPDVHGTLDRVGKLLLDIIGRFDIGVPMFFVISGYCIAATSDSARRSGYPRAEFFKRRFRRIFPPYWAALLCTIGASLLAIAIGGSFLAAFDLAGRGSVAHLSSLNVFQWLGNVTLTEKWRANFGGGPALPLLFVSWTLTYEEQFYILCGLLLVFASRRFYAGVAALTVLTLVTAFLGAALKLPISGFFFDGGWLEFAAGVFVFYHVNRAHKTAPRLVPAGLTTAIVVLMALRYVVFRSYGPQEWRAQLFDLLVAAVFAMVILVLARYDAAISRWPVLKPLAICGRMCYSLYLIHWPVTKLLCAALYVAGVRGIWPTLLIALPLATIVSLAAGWGFYLLIERHFLNPVSQARSSVPMPEMAAAPA